MRIVLSALACVCALAPTIAIADTVSASPFGARALPGQLARPMLPMARPVSPNVSYTTYAGKLVLNLSVSVQSAIKSGDVIECAIETEVVDTGSEHLIEDGATVAATRSGSTATCSIPLPYSWSLSTASQDTVSIVYTITNVGSNGAVDLPQRMSYQTFSTIAIPKSGATTTFSVKATI